MNNRWFIPGEGWKTRPAGSLPANHKPHKQRPLRPTEIADLPTHLTQIPTLYEQLPTLDEPDRTDPGMVTDQGHTDHKPGSRAPINLTAFHLTDRRIKPRGWRTQNPGRVPTIHRLGTLPALIWWVQLIEALADQAGVDVPGHPEGDATVATECAWLADVHRLVLAQPGAVLFVRDIARLHATLDQAIIGDSQIRHRCGTCQRVLEPTDDGAYECRGCGRVYAPTHLYQLARAEKQPRTAREIATFLGIPTATIRTWKARGQIQPVKRDSRGRQLFWLADAIRIKERIRDDD